MSTYICSDIHGMFKRFKKMLSEINFSENDTLYIIGDVIDRGEQSIELLQYIINNKNIHLILGNHEYGMIDYYRGKWHSESWSNHEWFTYGGKLTRSQFNKLNKIEKKIILDYLENLPDHIIIGNYILVHGGFNYNKNIISLEYALNNSTTEEKIWNRDFFKNDISIENYTVICGHTPTLDFGSDKIIFKNNKILIDCGCVYDGKLACLRLDDLKEFYA